MSISHNLETPSDKQKSDLELAQTLLDNLNSIRPSQYQKTLLKYDGSKFNSVQYGYQHVFLLSDIHLAIKNNFDEHNDFIIDTFQKLSDDYLRSKKSINDKELLKDESNHLFEYYEKYPKYSNETRFKTTIDNIKLSINNLLK